MSDKKILVVKTKYGSFECVFEPEPDMGGYMIEAKGVQGAISWGKNMKEAKKMIAESIEGAIETCAIIEAEKQGAVQLKNKKHPIEVL